MLRRSAGVLHALEKRRQCELWGAMQLRQGVFGQLRIVSNWSIDPLDLERDVTNVIPLRPNSEGLNPTQMIDRLHSLCEELQHVKSKALHLDKLLHLGPRRYKARPHRAQRH